MQFSKPIAHLSSIAGVEYSIIVQSQPALGIEVASCTFMDPTSTVVEKGAALLYCRTLWLYRKTLHLTDLAAGAQVSSSLDSFVFSN